MNNVSNHYSICPININSVAGEKLSPTTYTHVKKQPIESRHGNCGWPFFSIEGESSSKPIACCKCGCSI